MDNNHTLAGNQENLLFFEVQRTRQWWLLLLLSIPLALAWFFFVAQVVLGNQLGDRPISNLSVWIIWLVFGLGLPAFFFTVKLITEVQRDRLVVRFYPFVSRSFHAGEIERCYARTYRPIREYGGWGVRWSPKNGWAYNASGDRGVQLELTDGRRILIGSQKAEELCFALNSIGVAGGESS